MAKLSKHRIFDGKRFRLVKEGLSKSDAKLWKDTYKARGFRVRVVKGATWFTDKYKYSLYVY
jgi:hypothetical protein